MIWAKSARIRASVVSGCAVVLVAIGCSSSDEAATEPTPPAETPIDAGGDTTTPIVDSAVDRAPEETVPTAAELLAKVASCKGEAIKGGLGLNSAGSLSIYKCGTAAYWKADMDVDCDGIQTPPCDTDPTGQPQTSIVYDAPNGDVDPTKLPYIVIPLGKPQSTWYKAHGIELGQVGAVIYKGQLEYGIFADQSGALLGEASYAMCQLFLGKPTATKDPCSPTAGGIDAADVTYVTFTGAKNQATGTDIYDHAKHVKMGIAAAKTWLAE